MLTLPSVSKSKKNKTKIFEEISNEPRRCVRIDTPYVSIVRSVRTSPYAPYVSIVRSVRTSPYAPYVSIRRSVCVQLQRCAAEVQDRGAALSKREGKIQGFLIKTYLGHLPKYQDYLQELSLSP